MSEKTTISGGTSVIVRQFFDIVVGKIPVHKEKNEFQTVAVKSQDVYCLHCFTLGTWDVWEGRHDGLEFRLGRCRVCGHERTL